MSQDTGASASKGKFDPYFHSETIADTPVMRARRVRIDRGETVAWHVKPASTTTFFANWNDLVIQIRKPPFRNALRRGEHYTVAPNVEMAAYSLGGQPVEFTVFEYGECLDAIATKAPTLGYVVERSRSSEISKLDAIPIGPVEYGSFLPGFSRMDVIASPASIRLILQGHGANECVPWHSHDRITDTFFCVTGQARVETRQPDRIFELDPGDICQVEAGIAHFVSGLLGRPCEMLILQGVGAYNYVAR